MRRLFFSGFIGLACLVTTPAFAGVDIRVDLAAQRMVITTPDGETRSWPVSSGREGFRTPTGSYRVQLMKTYHWSRKYHGHMPHAIFFSGGYAIHGTDSVRRLGRPASSGCIRLHPSHARELFAMVREHGQGGTRIAISGQVGGHTAVASRRAHAAPGAEIAERAAPRPRVQRSVPPQATEVYEMPPVRRFQPIEQASAVGRFQVIERSYQPVVYTVRPSSGWR
jgi:L,D-transpeptidase catalytic domain